MTPFNADEARTLVKQYQTNLNNQYFENEFIRALNKIQGLALLGHQKIRIEMNSSTDYVINKLQNLGFKCTKMVFDHTLYSSLEISWE